MLEADVEIGSEDQQSYAHEHDHSQTFHSGSEQLHSASMNAMGQTAATLAQ